MKVFIEGQNGEKKETELLEAFQVLVLSVVSGRIEIPELTAYYKKRFISEAKQEEFESFTNH